MSISEPWQPAPSRLGAEARVPALASTVAAMAAVVPFPTLLPSNLIKGTLIHVRAKVMNERSATAVEEYSRTVGRWGSLGERTTWGLSDGVLDAGQGVGGGGASG